MFCTNCGKPVADGAYFCPACGKDLTTRSAPPAAPITAGPSQTSGKAIASLILGFFFWLLPAAIVGIILGHLSMSEIRKSAGRLTGQGLAVAGLVLGYMGIVAVPFILIIAAIAIPNLLRARIAANESSAVSAVRRLNAAEVAYADMHVETGYTCSLATLQEAGLIDSRLATGTRSGYVLELQNCTAETPGGPASKYQVVAVPVTKNQTGNRAFCSDESAVLRMDSNGSAQACLESGADLQ